MRLAKRVSGIAPSATLEITARAKKMAKEGRDIVNFGAGEPDFDTPDHIKDEAIKAIKEGFTKYTPSSGIPELKSAIAQKFKRDNGVDYSPSQIVVSNGAKHALYNILQTICESGDEVIIPSPYWLSYPEMVRMAGAKAIFIKTKIGNNFKADEKELASKITGRTRALILNSPSNPTGSVYNMDELKAIAGLGVKHKFFVISDEIYEKLIYDENRHISIASLGKDIYDLTITVNGVSKSYSMTGWRIGYAAGPKEVMDAVANLQSHSTSNPSSIGQKAALAALTGDQACVEQMKAEFEKRRAFMTMRLRAIKNISFVKPGGAFYIFCDISKLNMDSYELANRLLDEASLAVVPGEPFGDKFSMRLSFAASVETIKKGLDRLEEWVKRHG